MLSMLCDKHLEIVQVLMHEINRMSVYNVYLKSN